MFRPIVLPILLALLGSACATPSGPAPAKTTGAAPPSSQAEPPGKAPAAAALPPDNGPPPAAKTATPTAPPDFALNGVQAPKAVADCIADGLGKWKIPAAFIVRDSLDDGTQHVRLDNPATTVGGPEVFVRPRAAASRLEIYRHGLVMGSGWKRLLARCSR